MNTRLTLSVLATATLLNGCIVINADAEPTIHSNQNLVLNTDGIKTLEIEAGAGFLNIEGKAGAKEISLGADIWSQGEDTYTLTLERKGDTAILVAKNHSAMNFSWSNNSPQINVTLSLPDHLMLNINDGSGDITLENHKAKTHIQDGSGSIKVSDLKADLVMSDGSGPIWVRNLEGALELEDGSGGIQLDQISKSVNIDDGSGEILARHLGADITIEDNSGSITIEDAKGVVTIDDGSGSIYIDGAAGFNLIDDGSGQVKVANVEGKVNMQ